MAIVFKNPNNVVLGQKVESGKPSRTSQIILIDEAFAPLDPASKQLVQQKLKDLGMQCHICLALTWGNAPI